MDQPVQIPTDSVGMTATQTLRIPLPPEGLLLEGGQRLAELNVAYEAYGKLSPRQDNVIFLCHTLTGDAHAAGYHEPPSKATRGWWEDMVGPGKGIDTSHYYVVCANVLGGCKGTTGPGSLNPETGRPYGSAFPSITVGDMAHVHHLLLETLGIKKLAAVIGGSFGGMQALELAIKYPDSIERCISIASTTRLSAQALAFDIVGREAITTDPNWQSGDYYGTGRGPLQGLAQARKIGHITYISPEMMNAKFGREKAAALHASAGGAGFHTEFQVESYLAHKGETFVQRFDANSYLHISHAMDQYDLEAAHGGTAEALKKVGSRLLIIALSSDWLFPPEQSIELTSHLIQEGKTVSYCGLESPHGHDAFLLDILYLSDVVRAFLPWVEETVTKESVPRAPMQVPYQSEHEMIAGFVQPNSKVLDMGCGDGALLSLLKEKRGSHGTGVEIDIEKVIAVIDRGHDVLQADIDGGLAMIPDGMYDYAILSETLQVVRKPRFVLKEILRVAREGIVTFPNFGMLGNRINLLTSGRMPVGRALPFEWYDTPNIHLFTYNDFVDICAKDGIRILEIKCVAAGWLGRRLIDAGLHSLGADRILARITRHESHGRGKSV